MIAVQRYGRANNVVPFAIETMPAYQLQFVTERAAIMMGDACTRSTIYSRPCNDVKHGEANALYGYAWRLLTDCTREATQRLEQSGDPR